MFQPAGKTAPAATATGGVAVFFFYYLVFCVAKGAGHIIFLLIYNQ